MGSYVLDFHEVDQTMGALVGGKGANLGELSRIDGIGVPAGFCVTTDAYQRMVADGPGLDQQLDRLSQLAAGDQDTIGRLSGEIRRTIEAIALADDVSEAIAAAVARLGDGPYAVRSSATAEDLPTASFAGQQDTYLNVIGSDAVLESSSRCWASLFTDRAVTYRVRNGIDHRQVLMAVVVQRMVVPDASGVMFTADPVTSNRKVVSIEATVGLGEALVSGLVNADSFQVRNHRIASRALGAKQLAIRAVATGGTEQVPIEATRQEDPALTDEQAVELARLGRRIEAHFGRPQDIEWCLADGAFQFVQSRPITTLYPVPVTDDDANHLYISVGHQQMMTDAMKPLGISMWQMTGQRRFDEAGGRLFVDVAAMVAVPAVRARLLALWQSDPLVGDALRTALEWDDFIPLQADDGGAASVTGPLPPAPSTPIAVDPALVPELIGQREASLAELHRTIAGTSGAALFDFIEADMVELKRLMTEPRSHQVYMSAMDASAWLNEHLEEWLGEKNVADTLSQSVPHNITSEMGLALLDVADAIRPHPEVVAFLEAVGDDDCFLDRLSPLAGGPEAREAIRAFLDVYGMRCVGEIDITRPRWSERPTELVPAVLGNVKNFEPGEASRRFERGRDQAEAKEVDVLARLAALSDGDEKVAQTKASIDRVRTYIGYREYPKYAIISRHFAYKQALMAEADLLVAAGVIGNREDVFFLTFGEFRHAVESQKVDPDLVAARRQEFASYQALTPPRVLTSDGEIISGSYRRDDAPAGAFVGLAVSSGTVEGRARVIADIAEADLEPGDILVTAFTDPSWSPLFVAIAGLVTEVGGLMTHGAVIAREYGLPAVVGVERATRLIRDGQRIRVDGTNGYVEVLP